jgi:hypothetical protein
MKTYLKMNKEIVGILRISGRPHEEYAAVRIEELEQALEPTKNFINDLTAEVNAHHVLYKDDMMHYLLEERVRKLKIILSDI